MTRQSELCTAARARRAAAVLRMLLALSCLLLPTNTRPALAKPDAGNTLRIATLAPRGSTLVTGFARLDAALGQATAGAWRIQLYPSGVAGDESACLRKMRIGQLDGAALTSVGLSQVLRELAVLTAPGAIDDYVQLERVQAAMNREWAVRLADDGLMLLSWADIGQLRYFTKAPIYRPSDLRRQRPWVWPEAHTMKATWHALGVTGVPLGVPEVYGALQTGIIDAVITTALAVVALQWHASLTHVTKRRHGPLVGGLVINKPKWDGIPAGMRATLEQQIQTNFTGENLNVRKNDEQAYQNLLRRGYTATAYTVEGEAEYQQIAAKSRESLVGRVYSRELLDKVMKIARGVSGE